MRRESADAPAKLILLGEHAVVYGEPALAVPLRQPRAQAEAAQTSAGRPAAVALPDCALNWEEGSPLDAPEMRTFQELFCVMRKAFPAVPAQGWTLTVRSSIPAGCGLGSGAAVCAASLRAILRCFGVPHNDQSISALVYEVEKLHHGNPSGIDNTVVAMGRPLLFRRGAQPRFLAAPAQPPCIVVGHTGVRHRTAEVVADVARVRGQDQAGCDAMFREMGQLAGQGAEAFERGDWRALGGLMERNQSLLEKIGVSSSGLDALIAAARRAGALGAKLSGAGRGGCMAALADGPEAARRVEAALQSAGAAATFLTGLPEHVPA